MISEPLIFSVSMISFLASVFLLSRETSTPNFKPLKALAAMIVPHFLHYAFLIWNYRLELSPTGVALILAGIAGYAWPGAQIFYFERHGHITVTRMKRALSPSASVLAIAFSALLPLILITLGIVTSTLQFTNWTASLSDRSQCQLVS